MSKSKTKNKTRAKSYSGRWIAAQTLGKAAKHFPKLPATPTELAQPNGGGAKGQAVDARERRLALAITRTALQRWLSIEYLLDRVLDKPARNLEPALRGLLLSAGAQLLFMDRLPVHAVVDESVELAGSMVRRGAKGLVNAVLRRLAEMIGSFVPDSTWIPAKDRIPLDSGYVKLTQGFLPDPKENPLAFAEAATSHPKRLTRRFIEQYGDRHTNEICLAGVRTPPIIIAVEPKFAGESDSGASSSTVEPDSTGQPSYIAHKQLGFIQWQGDQKSLVAFLSKDRRRRVQDPTAAAPVAATADLKPGLIIDYCAGRGTKTRQCAALHPEARVLASDVNQDRFKDLCDSTAAFDNVEVLGMSQLIKRAKDQPADLIILDVPCTNTGVLARRPEARYRFNDSSLNKLVQLQRRIITEAISLLGPGGHLLYSTCSLLAQENQQTARWMKDKGGVALVQQVETLPQGMGSAYIDGGYFTLFKRSN